jgi:DeoR/GlpR family transcriptional regulator of sugar metabolism
MVVSNSPAIVLEFQHSPGISVTLVGGHLEKDILYCAGFWTRQVLTEIRLDKAVLGVTAIDPSYGMSTANPPEAEIKRLLIKAAQQRIGLADHTKFGRQRFAFVGPVTDLNILVTDSGIEHEYVEKLTEQGVKVVIASCQAGSPSAHTS